ncbi:hypothetical protein LguiB_020465 [Lonicera macranthoides]
MIGESDDGGGAAVVCWEEGKAAKVEEIQVDTPKAGEVKVNMLFTSLCHTDLLCCKGFSIDVKRGSILARALIDFSKHGGAALINTHYQKSENT